MELCPWSPGNGDDDFQNLRLENGCDDFLGVVTLGIGDVESKFDNEPPDVIIVGASKSPECMESVVADDKSKWAFAG